MLPAHPVSRHRVFRRLGQCVRLGKQGGFHIIRICGLGEIVNGTKLYGGNSRRDIAVARQHDSTGVLAGTVQRLDHVETIAIFKAQIHHRIGWRGAPHFSETLTDAGGKTHVKPPAFHRAAKAGQEGLVIVHDQQRLVRQGVHGGGVARQIRSVCGGHGLMPSCSS